MVGTFGIVSTRLVLVTARMRTLPESAPALADGRLANVIWAWPAITSCIAGASPRYGNVRDGDASHALEQFGRQVRNRAIARRRHIELARIGLGVGEQLLHVLDRQVIVHDQRVGGLGHQRHRLHALDGIVRQLAVDGRCDGLAADGAQQQHRAIRLGTRHLGGGDGAAAARLVLHHDGDLGVQLKLRGDRAGDDIVATAGREADQHPHRARWQVLGHALGCGQREGDGTILENAMIDSR